MGMDSEDEFGPEKAHVESAVPKFASGGYTGGGPNAGWVHPATAMFVGDVPPWPGMSPGLPAVQRPYSYPNGIMPAPNVQVDYVTLLEEAKSQAVFKALRKVLDAAEAVTTEVRGRSYGDSRRSPDSVRADIVKIIKDAMK